MDVFIPLNCAQMLSAPSDYIDTTHQLTFGGITRRFCQTVRIVDDDNPEREESFSVILSSSDPQVRINRYRRSATIVIEDNDGKPLACVIQWVHHSIMLM